MERESEYREYQILMKEKVRRVKELEEALERNKMEKEWLEERVRTVEN